MEALAIELDKPKTFISKKSKRSISAVDMQRIPLNALLQMDDFVIEEEHKRIVRERIKKQENFPDSYLSWNDIEQKMAVRV